MLQETIDSDGYGYAISIFADRSAALIRIVMTLVAVLLISAESTEKDQFKYRRAVKYCLTPLLFSEIMAFGLQLNDYSKPQIIIRKIGVELVYILLNCSVVYHMNKFLGNPPSTLTRVFYGAAVLILVTGILNVMGMYNKYGKLTYAANAIVSFYTLGVLCRLKSYFENLGQSAFQLMVTIPVTHIALLRLEIVIFLLNVIDYSVSLYYGSAPYEGWHVVHQLSACICLMYLMKMYIIIVEWRGIY
eukprot:UN10559